MAHHPRLQLFQLYKQLYKELSGARVLQVSSVLKIGKVLKFRKVIKIRKASSVGKVNRFLFVIVLVPDLALWVRVTTSVRPVTCHCNFAQTPGPRHDRYDYQLEQRLKPFFNRYLQDIYVSATLPKTGVKSAVQRRIVQRKLLYVY